MFNQPIFSSPPENPPNLPRSLSTALFLHRMKTSGKPPEQKPQVIHQPVVVLPRVPVHKNKFIHAGTYQ